nr:MAG: hypothetical protein [Bacteriophage sp.]
MNLSYEEISMRVDNMLEINTDGEQISRATYFYIEGYLKAFLETGVLNEYEFSKLKEHVTKHKYSKLYLKEG